MTIGALAPMIQGAMQLATELVKMASKQMDNKNGEGDKDKIASEDMHNKNRVDFASKDSTNNNMNINISS
ncbi:hypothetical protein [Pseudomonas sp. B22129]|uniref:hypothetical protein n=1 Tax=Pseudomonas sp. B22129 TaxID=3235111 RepID=UPI0037836EE7